MKVSLNWLKDYVDINVGNKEFAELLTHTGTKVEGYEVMGEDITGVVVGKVLSMERHPDSDHLWICSIDVGAERPLQIVTGAQNVIVGALVPVCTNGAHLPDGKVIKTGKLRGVVSEGMLCSIGELGLTTHDFPYAIEDGIFLIQEDCKVGDDIRDVCRLKDTVVEFELTFNRPDCLSYIGIAREAAVSLKTPLKLHKPVVPVIGDGDSIDKHLKVNVQNTVLCPRYTARMVKNVKIAESPLWLRAKLRAAGVRPINNIVDITNYVMIEYGQPMHAFDYNFISSREINVRNASAGETIVTLDGNERKLTEDMLVIADGQKPVALAGVMGGENSEITNETTTVVFESANFNRENIRKTSRSVGLRTESSAKYEKGLPPCTTGEAADRAVELVIMLGCGEPVDGVIDVCNADIGYRRVKFDAKRINEILGTSLTYDEMASLLAPIELIADGDELIVPPYRADIINTADVAEEVVRLYGFENIQATLFSGNASVGHIPETRAFGDKARSIMCGLGFNEVYTYSFISPKAFDKICVLADSELRDCIKLINPLGEDTSVMRTTGLPSLLETAARNYSRRLTSGRIYEYATVYFKDGKMSREERRLNFLFWNDGDFYDMSGYVSSLLEALHIEGFRMAACTDNPTFHPGRTAKIAVGDKVLGTFGQLHPFVQNNYGFDCPVYAAELNMEELFRAVTPVRFEPIPLFPPMERDLALLVDRQLEAAVLCDTVKKYGGKYLENAYVFDVYTGKGVDESKKSMAIRLLLRKPDTTMTDTEADSIIKKILTKVEADLGATLRS